MMSGHNCHLRTIAKFSYEPADTFIVYIRKSWQADLVFSFSFLWYEIFIFMLNIIYSNHVFEYVSNIQNMKIIMISICHWYSFNLLNCSHQHNYWDLQADYDFRINPTSTIIRTPRLSGTLECVYFCPRKLLMV